MTRYAFRYFRLKCGRNEPYQVVLPPAGKKRPHSVPLGSAQRRQTRSGIVTWRATACDGHECGILHSTREDAAWALFHYAEMMNPPDPRSGATVRTAETDSGRTGSHDEPYAFMGPYGINGFAPHRHGSTEHAHDGGADTHDHPRFPGDTRLDDAKARR